MGRCYQSMASKGNHGKEIVAIQTSHNEEFVGYENVVLPYEN